MQPSRHTNKLFLFSLVIVVWLAAAPPAPAAAIGQPNQPSQVVDRIASSCSGRACPPSSAQHTVGKPARDTTTPNLSQRERQRFDTPSCSLEERLFADAADGRLDAFSPFGAALVASGVEDSDGLSSYQQKAAALVDQLRRSDKLTDKPRQRAEAVFQFMRQRILHGGYDLTYTDLRRVLDEGRYNCVSATVLFNYLACELGLDCHGLQMPGHAMSRVSLPDGTLDIENTAPGWFCRNGDPRQEAAVAGLSIGTAATADRSKARPVSAIQLAAMIYYNRGVDLLGEKRFVEAARANAKALRLDPQNATARGNLLATLNNWAIELGNRQRFAEAVDLLRQGLAIEAQFEACRQNFVHVHHQWVEHLCGEGRFAEAIVILSRAAAEMPDRDYFRKTQVEVRQRWAKSTVAATTKR